MTNQEAIEYFKEELKAVMEHLSWTGMEPAYYKAWERDRDAIKLAIKALTDKEVSKTALDDLLGGLH